MTMREYTTSELIGELHSLRDSHPLSAGERGSIQRITDNMASLRVRLNHMVEWSDRCRADRDSARRELCTLIHELCTMIDARLEGGPATPRDIAESRGWDCFDEPEDER